MNLTLGWCGTNFYPRPPRGGRRQHIERCSGVGQFLSTPSARRATAGAGHVHLHGSISIHALREEGDLYPCRYIRQGCAISIHALREEGDNSEIQNDPIDPEFLSTPSARRATRESALSPLALRFLSTPSARRATKTELEENAALKISIHALREEGDQTAHVAG